MSAFFLLSAPAAPPAVRLVAFAGIDAAGTVTDEIAEDATFPSAVLNGDGLGCLSLSAVLSPKSEVEPLSEDAGFPDNGMTIGRLAFSASPTDLWFNDGDAEGYTTEGMELDCEVVGEECFVWGDDVGAVEVEANSGGSVYGYASEMHWHRGSV